MPDILCQHFPGFPDIYFPFRCFHTHLGNLIRIWQSCAGQVLNNFYFFVGRNQLWESQYELNTNSRLLLLSQICTLVPQQNQSKQKCKDSALVIRSNCQITLCFDVLILHTWSQKREKCMHFFVDDDDYVLLIHVKLEHMLLSGIALFSSIAEHRDYMK